MILVYVMIAIVVNKDEKCLKLPDLNKVKSGTFRTVSEYKSNEIIDLLEKSQLDEKYGVLNKEQEKFKENKKIEIY